MSENIRHFVLETKDFGKFDVVEYKEYQKLEIIIKEVREYIKQTGQYLEDIKRFKVDVLEPDYLNILEILDKGKE